MSSRVSLSGTHAGTRAGAGAILGGLGGFDFAFGVGNYKDFGSGDPYAFQPQQSVTKVAAFREAARALQGDVGLVGAHILVIGARGHMDGPAHVDLVDGRLNGLLGIRRAGAAADIAG